MKIILEWTELKLSLMVMKGLSLTSRDITSLTRYNYFILCMFMCLCVI